MSQLSQNEMTRQQNQIGPISGSWPLSQSPDFLSKEEIDLLKRTMLAEFPPDQQQSFIRTCERTRLDPFIKQIYPTRRYQKVRVGPETKKIPILVTVTGIMGLTAVATRSGHYDGCEIAWAGKDGKWREEWLEADPPEGARCKVYHKQRSHPEVFIARWGSYVGQTYDYESKSWNITDFWQRMGDWMLAKCAKAGALRGAFPDQLSNVYIREELESNITEDATESIDEEEQHYREAREKEAALVAARPEGMVTPSKPPPDITPEQALEPALETDRIPAKPVRPTASKPGIQDELDMSPPAPPLSTPWRDHVIRGMKPTSKYQGRKLGDLNRMEVAALAEKYVTAVYQQSDRATDEQHQDARMIEAADSFYKMEKPF
jgi:phage recombination protein Bet